MADLARNLSSMTGGAGAGHLNFHIYADDVLLYVDCSPKDIHVGTEKLQQALLCAETWMRTNHLLLSLEKTDLFLVHGARASLPATIPPLKIAGKSLEFRLQGNLRWLGVLFDPGLSMKEFVANTCRTCFFLLKMLHRIRGRMDHPTATLLCNALILSRADYCCSLLASATKETQLKLQRVVNLAARITSKCHRQAHISPILRELQWLPVELRVNMRLAILVRKCQCGRAPGYLSNAITTYLPRRPLRSGSTSSMARSRTLALVVAPGVSLVHMFGMRCLPTFGNRVLIYMLSKHSFGSYCGRNSMTRNLTLSYI